MRWNKYKLTVCRHGNETFSYQISTKKTAAQGIKRKNKFEKIVNNLRLN